MSQLVNYRYCNVQLSAIFFTAAKGRSGSCFERRSKGVNQNPFFRLEEIQDAVIAAQTKVVLPVLKNTLLYDLSTQGGKQYKLIII